MTLRKSVLGALVAVTTVLAGIAVGAQGAAAGPAPDDLVIGPGASLMLRPQDTTTESQGSSQDNQGALNQQGVGGEQFNFGLKTRLGDRSVLMGLGGGAISLCSIHGPSAEVDMVTENGNFPLQGMQCGRAFGMDIALDGCSARLEYHGFVHSDRSTRIYFGPMTADITFQKTGSNTGNMKLTVFTPKAPIVLQGQVQSPTPIVMTTCP